MRSSSLSMPLPMPCTVTLVFPRTLRLGIYVQAQATVQRTDPPDTVIPSPKVTTPLLSRMTLRILCEYVRLQRTEIKKAQLVRYPRNKCCHTNYDTSSRTITQNLMSVSSRTMGGIQHQEAVWIAPRGDFQGDFELR